MFGISSKAKAATPLRHDGSLRERAAVYARQLLLIVQDGSRCRFDHFKLRSDFLDLRHMLFVLVESLHYV
jgi:hypothetical protein